ncbi:MAG: hypothetical protein IJ324_04265 [Lachnospiraceae bacterium]|nr:hypothetical protein [Lachnospiraceae bacterium]
MNEGKNKREWIKNAVIVFLVIMLLLTFFSNTIMNYSLPEVAVQYVESGSITAKIRGNGVIESGDPYYVTIEQQRKVEAVNVRPGDMVQEGDVLAVLSASASSDMKTKEQEVKAAEEAMDAAQKQFETLLLTGGYDVSVMNNAGEMASADSLAKQIIKLKNKETALKDDISGLEADIADVDEQMNAISLQLSINSINNIGSEQEYKDYTDAVAALSDANTTLERVRVEKENYEIQYGFSESDVNSTSNGDAALDRYQTLVRDYNAMQTQVNWLTFNKNETEKVLTEKLESSNTGLNGQKNNLTVQKNNLQKSLDEKNTELSKVSEDLAELTKNITDSSALQTASEAITKAQETYQELLAEYEEMQGVAIDTEVVAPFTGTIVSVPISAGTDTIDSPGEGKGYTIVTMQREGRGYTMEFSVTNDQAKRIAVGDEAEVVNSWRYDNMTLTVSGIKNDLKNPGQGKVITLDVRGDYITPGQNISVSVGEKSANYDMIVPNSAIREDNNGKFVLLVETKSSPLGNRYIATRADVKVVASDDTKSAITGDLYAWSYVITTSTAPVEAGQQVRLAEN